LQKKINSKVRGTTHDNLDGTNRQTIIEKFVNSSEKLWLEYEADNQFFNYAVAVYTETESQKKQIGYLSNQLALQYYDRLNQVECYVEQVTGKDDQNKFLGVNIRLIVPEDEYPKRILVPIKLNKATLKRIADEIDEYTSIEIDFYTELDDRLPVVAHLDSNYDKEYKIGYLDNETADQLKEYQARGLSIDYVIDSVTRDIDDNPEKIELLITIETSEQDKAKSNKPKDTFIETKPIQAAHSIPVIQPPKTEPAIQFTKPTPIKKQNRSPKSKTIALILCILFGWLGGHQFYAGRKILGIVYIFTVGLFMIGWVIDFVMILLNKYKDKSGKIICNW